MKKLVFLFALMCGAMFTSCGNIGKNAEQVDSVKVDTTIVDTVAVDSMVVDTLVADILDV